MNTQMDEKLMVIFERRSIRVYSPGEVDEATVQKLLAAAMAAPSAAGKNPWHFVVVRNRPTLSRIAVALHPTHYTTRNACILSNGKAGLRAGGRTPR